MWLKKLISGFLLPFPIALALLIAGLLLLTLGPYPKFAPAAA